MVSHVKEIILTVFQDVIKAQNSNIDFKFEDNTVLLDTGLDSLDYAIIVGQLQEKLGFDPFSLSEEAYYPKTFGELVAFYEKHHAM